jgi:hypothetical protein
MFPFLKFIIGKKCELNWEKISNFLEGKGPKFGPRLGLKKSLEMQLLFTCSLDIPTVNKMMYSV